MAQEQIVATLCVEAPNDTIRNCLRKYVPSKSAVQIQATFKQEKKQTLVETLAYLGVPNMEQYRADALPHEMICRIQNLFPDTCHLCSKSYCVKLHDKPIVSCARCGQGCHDECFLRRLGITESELNEENEHGISLLNPHAAVGFIYFCGYCQKEVVPQKEDLKIKSNTKKKTAVTPGEETVPINSTASDPSSSAISEDCVEGSSQDAQDNSVEGEHQRNENQTLMNAPSQTLMNAPSQTLMNAPSQTRLGRRQPNGPLQVQDGVSEVCKFYKQGRCRHGISGKKDGACEFSHPKPCQKFLTNGNRRQRGCTLGAQCRFFHPRVCNSSLRERICTKHDCKYLHIRGTKRSAGETSPNASEEVQETLHQPSGTRNKKRASAQEEIQKDSTSFLEQLSSLNEKMSLFSSKLQQMDYRYSLLLQPLMLPPTSGMYPSMRPDASHAQQLHPQAFLGQQQQARLGQFPPELQAHLGSFPVPQAAH